ncbi:MAG: OmpA family protein [Bacteroidota bacterium]|nr:OmpA family protein [Bacteroidota bacterium]
MVAWIQAWDALRRVRRVLVCVLLAWCAVPALAQVRERPIQTDRKEGTLVVNYYSSAPDPELEQLRALTVDALGVYLRGQIRIQEGDIGWQLSLKHVRKDMERVVSDLMRIRDFAGQRDFHGFSEEVMWLLEDFEELDARDVGRMRGEGRLSEEERTYVLVEQRIQELLLQCGVELGHFVNRGLLQKMGTVEQTLTPEEMRKWTTPTDAPLEPIELDFNLETMSLIGGDDESAWPDETPPLSSSSSDPQLTDMQDIMQRILGLLESQEVRISALESRTPQSNATKGQDAETWVASMLDPSRTTPSQDAELRALNLPERFDVQFYEGSSKLTLTAQLQLNEVMEYMGMYPQLRVVCTGHADVTGDRVANLALSKRRAQSVQQHLLESGVNHSRVVLNYFGEERASNRGALDRRVEVSFFVND